MSDDATEKTPETPTGPTTRDDADGAPTTSGPSDDQLPGHRGDGPDPDPVDASEAEGGEVGAG